MAGSVNKIILVGNLGRNPEVRHAQSGNKIVQLSLATSESWKDKNSGERRERTEWHRVVIFNERLADVAEQYLRKGSKVYLEGQLATRKWNDNAGTERYTTEVVLQQYRGELVMLYRREGSGPPPAGSPEYYGWGDYGSQSSSQSGGDGQNPPLPDPDPDDEIPF